MNQQSINVVLVGASRDQFASDAERFKEIGLTLLDLNDAANISLEYRLADDDYDGPARWIIEIGDQANKETLTEITEIADDFGIADVIKRPLFNPNCLVPGADPAGCGTLIAALLLIVSATAALGSMFR